MEKSHNRQEKIAIAIAIAIAITSFLLILFAYYQKTALVNSRMIMDTDPYMRLVRVEKLYESGNWYDSTISRSNAPYGETLHWSRPLDIILIGLAMGLQFIMPFPEALFWAGIIVSPLIGCIAMGLSYWMIGPIVSNKSKLLVMLVFLSQPMVYQIFYFGRADHHSLLLTIFICLIGIVLRMLNKQLTEKHAVVTGVLMGLGFTVSVEFIFAIVLVMAVFSLLWMLYGDKYLKQALIMSGVLTIVTIIFVLIEQPPSQLFMPVYDKVSIVHIVVFIIMTVVLLMASKLDKKNTRLSRVFNLAAAGVVGLALLATVYPSFLKGPFAEVNPSIIPIWLEHVVEVQPLISPNFVGAGNFIMYMGLSMVSLLWFILIKKNRQLLLSSKWLLIEIGMILFGLLTLYQIRWLTYYTILSLPLIVVFISWILEFINRSISKKWLPIVRSFTILILLLGFTFVGGVFNYIGHQNDVENLQIHNIEELSRWLNQVEFTNENEILLTLVDYGPAILYHTNIQVIATPYHRNDEGILFLYDVMTESNMDAVKSMLAQRSVDWILIATSRAERLMYEGETHPDGFYQLLIDDKQIEWLEEKQLPKEFKDFRLFKVER